MKGAAVLQLLHRWPLDMTFSTFVEIWELMTASKRCWEWQSLCKREEKLVCKLETRFHIWVSVHHKSIMCNKPTRCNSGSIVFINNYKYKLVQLIVTHTQWNTSYCYLLKITVNKEQHVSAHESHHQAYKYGTSKTKNVQLSAGLYIEISCMNQN